jgi:signal transduction histidine kinase
MSAGRAPSRLLPHVAIALTVTGLLLTAAVTALGTTSWFGDERRGIGVLTIDDLHEGQLEASAAVVLTFIAAVMAARVRRQPTRRNLVLLAAICVLAFDNVVSALLTAGFDSLSASRFATWAAAGTGLVGAALLLVAVVLPDEPLARPRHASVRTFSVVGIGVLVSLGAAWLLRDLLPLAFETLPTAPDEVELLSEHPALLVTEALACLCWAVAGWGLISNARRTEDELTGWIGLGSLVAAVGFLNYTLFPSEFTELLYLGDYFYLLAVAILVLGAAREVGNAEAALVDSAVYAERRRIAREMHDGVAQELAYISAQTQAIRRNPEITSRALSQITDAVERGLDESRSAIKELSGPVDETVAHAVAVAAMVVGTRSGAEVELSVDESVVVPASARAALVRITREAVGNAIRHGHAERVRVDLWENNGAHLRITDDGSGFDLPSVNQTGGFGLSSIRERVANLGGDLRVSSAPGGGTVLEVHIP